MLNEARRGIVFQWVQLSFVMLPALCSLLWKELPPPAAIGSGVEFPDFWLVQWEAGNDSFRDWRAVETEGVPGNCSRLLGQSLETEKPGTPKPALCIMERVKEDLLSKGIRS